MKNNTFDKIIYTACKSILCLLMIPLLCADVIASGWLAVCAVKNREIKEAIVCVVGILLLSYVFAIFGSLLGSLLRTKLGERPDNRMEIEKYSLKWLVLFFFSTLIWGCIELSGPHEDNYKEIAFANTQKTFGEAIHEPKIWYAAGGERWVVFTDNLGDIYTAVMSPWGEVKNAKELLERKELFRKYPETHAAPVPQ